MNITHKNESSHTSDVPKRTLLETHVVCIWKGMSHIGTNRVTRQTHLNDYFWRPMSYVYEKGMSHVHERIACLICEHEWTNRTSHTLSRTNCMSHMWHVSCHTYEWVRSWTNRVTCQTYLNGYFWRCMSIYMRTACRTYECIMSHVWMRHKAHTACLIDDVGWMRESLHTNEERMSHVSWIWMSHVTHINELCGTYEWVVAHVWMSHVTTCPMCEWVMSHIWMRHVTHMNESWPLDECPSPVLRVWSHIELSHVTHMNESWISQVYQWVMSHEWMGHVTHINEPWMSRVHQWVMSHALMSHVTQSHVTRMDESCPMYKWVYEWVVSCVWMSHVTHINDSWMSRVYEWGISHIWIRHVTHMGWLQLVGSLKLWVSFAEYCLFYRALLQKRPIILRSLLIVATPY